MTPRAALTLAAALISTLGRPLEAQAPMVLAGESYGSLRGARAIIRFVRGDSLVSERVLALIDAQAPLPGLPVSAPGDVTAVLTHDPQAFDELTGGVVPEWRAGVGIPDRADAAPQRRQHLGRSDGALGQILGRGRILDHLERSSTGAGFVARRRPRRQGATSWPSPRRTSPSWCTRR